MCQHTKLFSLYETEKKILFKGLKIIRVKRYESTVYYIIEFVCHWVCDLRRNSSRFTLNFTFCPICIVLHQNIKKFFLNCDYNMCKFNLLRIADSYILLNYDDENCGNND